VSVTAYCAEKIAVVDDVGQNAPPVTVIGTLTPADRSMTGRLLLVPGTHGPVTEVAAVGATVTVHEARPLVCVTTPPCGMVRVAVEPAGSYWMETPHGPLVLFVVVAAVVNATLVLHAEEPLLNVGGSSGESTAPASLWLAGAADTEPAAVDSLQLTVTLPTVKVAATPETRDAWKLSPAGVTVVEEAAALAGEARARQATEVAAAAIARRVRLRRVELIGGIPSMLRVHRGRRGTPIVRAVAIRAGRLLLNPNPPISGTVSVLITEPGRHREHAGRGGGAGDT
jgi:hypothetical protein